MTTFVLDAGALLRLALNDRELWAKLRAQAASRSAVHVPTTVVAQVWRRGHGQARIALALKHCEELPFDGVVARAAGLLCGATRTSDIADAAVALAAAVASRSERTVVMTSDPDDIGVLLLELGSDVEIVRV